MKYYVSYIINVPISGAGRKVETIAKNVCRSHADIYMHLLVFINGINNFTCLSKRNNQECRSSFFLLFSRLLLILIIKYDFKPSVLPIVRSLFSSTIINITSFLNQLTGNADYHDFQVYAHYKL